MTNYDEFKRKLLERSEGGYIKEGFILQINGNTVNNFHISRLSNGDEHIFFDYNSYISPDIIFKFKVYENNEYQIEWFILETP